MIPIVMVMTADPVETGLVVSLAAQAEMSLESPGSPES
jgi:hypothetical protein